MPLYVSGPGIAPLGFHDARAQVADIAPTLLDAAGVPYAPEDFHGRSLMPVLGGAADAVYGDDDAIAFEVSGTAALFRGDWKIAKSPAPFGDGTFRLYDLSVDPGETTDLAAERPDLYADMVAEYERYASEVGVYEFAPGESARQQLVTNSVIKIFLNFWYVVVGALLAVLEAVGALVWGLRALLRRSMA